MQNIEHTKWNVDKLTVCVKTCGCVVSVIRNVFKYFILKKFWYYCHQTNVYIKQMAEVLEQEILETFKEI